MHIKSITFNIVYAWVKNQLLNLPTESYQHNTLKFSPICYWIWTPDVLRHNWHKYSLAALTHITAHFQHHPIYSHNPNTRSMSCFRNHECQSPVIYLDVIYTTALWKNFPDVVTSICIPLRKWVKPFKSDAFAIHWFFLYTHYFRCIDHWAFWLL